MTFKAAVALDAVKTHADLFNDAVADPTTAVQITATVDGTVLVGDAVAVAAPTIATDTPTASPTESPTASPTESPTAEDSGLIAPAECAVASVVVVIAAAMGAIAI